MTTATATEFLALYTGPGGPISALFVRADLESALLAIGENAKGWYDDGADCLGLDPDSPTLDADIESALSAGAWCLARQAKHDGDYDLYSRIRPPIWRAGVQLTATTEDGREHYTAAATILNRASVRIAIREPKSVGLTATHRKLIHAGLLEVVSENRDGSVSIRTTSAGRVAYADARDWHRPLGQKLGDHE